MKSSNLSAQKEKEQAFLYASVIGGCFLAIYFLTKLFNKLIIFIAHQFPSFWNYDNGNVADSFVYIFYAVICFALPAIVFSKIMGIKMYENVSFGRAKKGMGLPVFMAAVGIIPMANYINNIIVNIFKSYNYNPTDGIVIISPQSVAGMVLYAVHIAVIPAFCEELLCRAFVFGSLRKFGEHTAAVFSAVIFALFHKNFQQIPFAFVLGLVFAYAISISGSIWIPVLVHFINNLASFAFELLSQHTGDLTYRLVSGIYMMTLAVMGVIGIIWLSVKINKGTLDIPSYKGEVSAVSRNLHIYISPTVIAFVGLMLYLAIENMK